MSLTLQALLDDRPPVQVAWPTEDVALAMARMIEHDFSQLPVVDKLGPGQRVVGMISMTSIARASLHLGVQPSAMKVHHATDAQPVTAQAEHELWPTLERMRDGHALLVLGDERALLGLLTAADFASYLLSRTHDQFALQEIESTLKSLIERCFEASGASLPDAVIGSQKSERHSKFYSSVSKLLTDYFRGLEAPKPGLDHPRIKALFDQHFAGDVSDDFDRLTFHQYIELLLKECWSTFGSQIGLDPGTARTLLHELRDYRNRLAHQRGGLTPLERDRLRYSHQLFEGLADRSADDASAQVAAPAPKDPAQGRAAEPASGAALDAAPGDPPPRTTTDPGAYEAQELSPEPHPIHALIQHLRAVPPNESRLTILFSALERSENMEEFINKRLPSAARTSRSWWSNSEEENPNARLWLDEGWRMVQVNLSRETVTFGRNMGRNQAYIHVFSEIFSTLAASSTWYETVPSPAGRSWQPIAYLTGDVSARFVLAFASHGRFRVELYIDAGDEDTNKATFDALRTHSHELESAVGMPLSWERLDGKRACRVAAYFPEEVSVTSGPEDIANLAVWVGRVAPPFLAALEKRFQIVLPQSPESSQALDQDRPRGDNEST